ncbi:CobW family GTP-binding protein [Thalassolituus oleivorans]|nr:GTP-binding protein [Thalassolituus oleivorans]MDF1640713.1 GTP-binding protein [Thalassolituus oleivorans]
MIRVHLITGFLGVGKTTAILDVLANKPSQQKWAVLVNEFGEVGVDGTILAAQGAVVKEVPGGCLCCVSGLPFQMGLNLLIARENPDVILIEPTGLGHPRNILNMLAAEHYQSILELGATICLLDPRHLSQPRYTSNDVFKDQLQVADVLVANKTELTSPADKSAFDTLLERSQPPKAASYWTTQGHFDLSCLELAANPQRRVQFRPATNISTTPLANPSAPEVNVQETSGLVDASNSILALEEGQDIRRLENQGDGYFSVGWLLSGNWQFSLAELRHWLNTLNLQRAKGLLRTDQGYYVLNWRDGALTEMPTRALEESRIELIHDAALSADELERALLACRIN